MQIRTFAMGVLLLPVTVATASVAQNLNPRFQAERRRLQEWTQKNRDERGVAVTQELLAINPFKDSRIKIAKVAPTASVAITVPGNYPAGTVVLSERDGVTLSGVMMSPKSYAARLTVAPDELPGFARLLAITPISFDESQTFMAVAFVDVVYRMDLSSPNGITAKVTPLEKGFTIDNAQKNATVKYQAAFFRPGETKPFETVTGAQTFNDGSEPSSRFDIAFFQSTASPQAELENIGQQLADPKLTEAQRNALTERMAKVQQKMVEDMAKGLQADPASLNKKEDDFGCRSLQLHPGKAAGQVEGSFSCGKNFNGGVLKVAGTMTRVQ